MKNTAENITLESVPMLTGGRSGLQIRTLKWDGFVQLPIMFKFGLTQHPVHFLSSHPFAYKTEYLPVFQRLFPALAKRELKDFAVEPPCFIGNDVWLGSRVMIMDGVSVGDGAIIAAGAVVTKVVPPYATAGGVPAKVIRYRFSPETVDKLLKLKWLELDADFIMSLPFDDVESCIRMLEECRRQKQTAL